MKRFNSFKKLFSLLLLLMSTGFISKVNAQNGWVQMASMDEAKGGSQSCVIDSLIYVIGGVNNAVSTLNTTEFYNTETDEWEAKKNIPIDIVWSSAESIKDKIYVTGGWNSSLTSSWITIDSSFEYNPENDSWKTIKEFPVNTGSNASCVLNDKMYIFGGMKSASEASNFKQALAYDPANDTWDTLPNMLQDRLERFSACVLNNEIYVFGGFQVRSDQWIGIGNTEKYDPVQKKWIPLAEMPVPVLNHISLTYEDKLYLFGGDSGTFTANKSYPTNIIQEYDPTTDEWRLMDGMPFKRSDMTGQKVGKNLYLMGGYSINSRSWNSPLSEVWRFNLEELHGVGIRNTNADRLSIFPNPTIGLFTIETDQPDHHSLEIISLSGQVIYRTEMEGNSMQIDLTPLSKGIYFVTVRSKEFVRTEKIVKL